MKKIRNLFGGINMTWPKVIIFALASAVVTAVLNLIPALKDTSFQDIAVSFECWILFALLIILNCKKWYEASIKTFVYFVISQPLIYLIEVPFNSLGWGLFDYYRYWAVVTVLTLPGAAIAFLVKKKNWLSAAVLSVANCFLAYMCVEYSQNAIMDFPHHLLSAVFCIALAVFFIFVLLDDAKQRIACLMLVIGVIAGTAFYKAKNSVYTAELGEGSWSAEVEDESIAQVKMVDGNTAKIVSKSKGTTYVYFTDENGNTVTYYATVGGNIYCEVLED